MLSLSQTSLNWIFFTIQHKNRPIMKCFCYICNKSVCDINHCYNVGNHVPFQRKSAVLLCRRKHEEDAIFHFKQSFQVLKIADGGRWETLMENNFQVIFLCLRRWIRESFTEGKNNKVYLKFGLNFRMYLVIPHRVISLVLHLLPWLYIMETFTLWKQCLKMILGLGIVP